MNGATELHVEGISKQYRIYNRPSDRLVELVTRGHARRHREFWALRDVSFTLEPGTTTGIIGPNGCGKSTLLQIIAGTLEPTTGSVRRNGRVSALLELGAGFNPEFTGIENVFMNGALMGFSRNEIRERLPEIERFAEIGSFLSQPVKTYSSGMYVRLAFAIAVSADPQILIIDEALAVGDTVFQHRCLRRIKDMQERGATVLFVSHDPAAVRALCNRAILLNAGRVIADGAPPDVFNRYQKIIMEREEAYERKQQGDTPTDTKTTQEETPHLEKAPLQAARAPVRYTYRHGDGSAEIVSAELLDHENRFVEIVETGTPLVLRMCVRFHKGIDAPVVGFLIRNRHGIHAYGANTEQQELNLGFVRQGEVIEIVFAFDCWLGVDSYSISLAVHSSVIYDEGAGYDWLDGALFFRVTGIVEGIANLHACVTAQSLDAESVGAQPETREDVFIR
ncbi:MAG: ABC transporter ATP-binding protein [Pyrinomonadaceae bacterium]|nr:ABC transporter ATP-binding protein [Pyrinomonadaceae bacterium]